MKPTNNAVNADTAPTVYLHREPIDFRRQINGLSLIVQEQLALDPFSGSLFVFVNRSRSALKILYYERNGFCLWLKKLERDKFAWPKHLSSDVVTLSSDELQWLLQGFDLWRHSPHQRLHYRAA